MPVESGVLIGIIVGEEQTETQCHPQARADSEFRYVEFAAVDLNQVRDCHRVNGHKPEEHQERDE